MYDSQYANPANTTQSTNAGLMSIHRHGQWTDIKQALVECVGFAGTCLLTVSLSCSVCWAVV